MQAMKFALPLFILLLSIGACSTYTPPAPPAANALQHQVQVLTEDAALRQAMVTAMQQKQGVVAVTEDGLSPLRLFLKVEPYERSATAKAAPQLFGRLTPAPESSNVVVSYKLATIGGTLLDEGEAVGVGLPKVKLYPGGNNSPDALAYEDVIGQIMPRIEPHIKAQSWRTPVVAVVDALHVLIAAGRSSGLKAGTLLTTEALPEAVLEVVTFERMPTGNERAVLRLKSGTLPTVGKTLIPAK